VVLHRLAIMSKDGDWVLREDAEAGGTDVVPLEPLAAMKLTKREKDYAVIGELARRMTDPRAHDPTAPGPCRRGPRRVGRSTRSRTARMDARR
jgi:hypothetical protein